MLNKIRVIKNPDKTKKSDTPVCPYVEIFLIEGSRLLLSTKWKLLKNENTKPLTLPQPLLRPVLYSEIVSSSGSCIKILPGGCLFLK